MKKWNRACLSAVSAALCALLWLTPAMAAMADTPEELIPLGGTVGIELKMGGVMVVSLSPVPAGSGEVGPAEAAGLRAGDLITEVGGKPVTCAADFLSAAAGLDGSTVTVVAERDGEPVQFAVEPAQNDEGVYQMGLWLRDGISGIGTMTYYDPASGVYGALGHGINDLETGELVEPKDGSISASEVIDVLPGSGGTPGELCGRMDKDAYLGSIDSNTDSGIFGVLAEAAGGECVPVAGEDEITLGPASILSNVSGSEVRAYDVEITRLYHDAGDSRCLMLRVTDPDLLAVTGGIVQGMSGSPILQNGKLVGAVTHVLVQDPQKGYGISIERMLKTAENEQIAA